MTQKKDQSKKEKNKEVRDKVLLGELADLIMETIQVSNDQEEIEPFETYSAHLRARLLNDSPDFSSRFVRGYELLLEELKKEKENQEEE
jgi:hypothetical protein